MAYVPDGVTWPSSVKELDAMAEGSKALLLDWDLGLLSWGRGGGEGEGEGEGTGMVRSGEPEEAGGQGPEGESISAEAGLRLPLYSRQPHHFRVPHC